MTISVTPSSRRRRAPDVLRKEALEAARQILFTEGPAAVTLQRVAGLLDMAHGNITHHFGSASNLQAALADTVIADLIASVRAGTCSLRAGTITECDLVDLVFDVFEETGVGRLIGWLASQGSPRLNSLYQRFGQLPAELAEDPQAGAILKPDELPALIASVVISALGASLIGSEISCALGLPRSFMRNRVTEEMATQRLIRVVEID